MTQFRNKLELNPAAKNKTSPETDIVLIDIWNKFYT